MAAAPVGDTTPPTVSLTSPTSGQQVANGAVVDRCPRTPATTSAVARVEFRIDGMLVDHGHLSSPYSFSAGALAAGSHSAQATAVDTATPPNSSSTAIIPFTVLGGTEPAVPSSPRRPH